MITLRRFTPDDVPVLQHLLNEAAVTRYLSTKIPQPYTADDARWWVTKGSLTGINLAIEFQGQLAGSIGVNPGSYEYARSGELGFWLGQSFWRQGIGLNAVSQLTQQVFAETDIVRIYAAVFAGNVASMSLLQKAGFTEECVQRKAIYKSGQFYDCHCFALLR